MIESYPRYLTDVQIHNFETYSSKSQQIEQSSM